MTAIVEIEMVAVDADTVEPRQNTRDVRGILPRRTDQILLHIQSPARLRLALFVRVGRH